MPTLSSTRSRIPIRASSCPKSPKPRHLRLLHSGLITIPEESRQSSADAILTRMPRVKSSDSLYKPMTDKMLPQLPQLDMVPEDTPEATIAPTIRKVSNDTITEEKETNDDLSEARTTEDITTNTVRVRPPIPQETIPYAESAWHEFHIQDAKLTRCTLSMNLQTAIDQIKSHLTSISTSNTRYNCLISLLDSIAETNKPLQSHHHRAVDQHHALFQKKTQLVNASNFVLECNDVLIDKCRLFLADPETSCHELQVACERSLAHAKESITSQQNKRIPKLDDFGKDLESLITFNKDISTIVENITSINGLLDSHKHNVDTQVASLEADVVKLASKRSSGVLGRMLCFQ